MEGDPRLVLKEAIILAGGLGTRLKSVIADSPKPMAYINGVPFLTFILDYLVKYGVERVVLSVGYKHEQISNYYGGSYRGVSLDYVVETNLLGTGGALAESLQWVNKPNVLVLNGDSFFNIDLVRFSITFEEKEADVLLALKLVNDVSRYGLVEMDKSGRLISFNEKKRVGEGTINAGVYLLKRDVVLSNLPVGKCSFEEDFLTRKCSDVNIVGQVFNEKFVDIGTPSSYRNAINLLTQ